jgi:hypothetical protein
MGGNSSSSTVSQVNDFFNQTTNSFISKNSQSVSATATNINSASFKGAVINGCAIKLTQSITSDTVATGQMTAKSIQDLTTTLANSANTAIQNASTQSNGFLAPSVANSATAVTNLQNHVTNIIQNTMESDTVQNIFAKANNTNAADFSGVTYTCQQWQSENARTITIDQNIKATIVAKGVSDALTQAITSDSVVNAATSSVAQSATQKNAGLDDLVKSIGDLLSGMFGAYSMYIVGCCIVCCCLLCFLLVGAVAMGGSGGGAPPQSPGNISAGLAAVGKMPVTPA